MRSWTRASARKARPNRRLSRANALLHLVVNLAIIASILLVPVTHQTIIVLDFGSQYTQLIARRLRELSVYSEIWPPDTPLEKIRARASGRHHPVGRPEERVRRGRADVRCRRSTTLGRPVLGICYGMQLMARSARRTRRAGAAARVRPRDGQRSASPAALFADVAAEIRVWASHGDFVAAAPAGFSVVATSANAPIAAMSDAERALYAMLFHPEVVHTERGLEILRNFALRHLRLHRRLDDGVVCRGGDGADSRAGRRRPRRLRAERRRRFDGRGAASSTARSATS